MAKFRNKQKVEACEIPATVVKSRSTVHREYLVEYKDGSREWLAEDYLNSDIEED